MRRPWVLASTLVVLLSALARPAAGADGFLYVLNANATGSTIYGFRANETTGDMTLLPGFPLPTGGTGTDVNCSQQLAVNTTNWRVYAINDGSDTVSAFAINVVTGALTPLPFSPITLGSGSWFTVAVHPSGSPLLVSGGGAPTVRSYVVTATSATPASGSPFSTGGIWSTSSAFSAAGGYFYTGGNSVSAVAGFSVSASTGALTALPTSPYAVGGMYPLAYATDSQGRLFLANYNDQTARVFTTASGVPSAVTGNPFGSGLTEAADGLLHRNETLYFVADRAGNRVGSYRIAGTGAFNDVDTRDGVALHGGGNVHVCARDEPPRDVPLRGQLPVPQPDEVHGQRHDRATLGVVHPAGQHAGDGRPADRHRLCGSPGCRPADHDFRQPRPRRGWRRRHLHHQRHECRPRGRQRRCRGRRSPIWPDGSRRPCPNGLGVVVQPCHTNRAVHETVRTRCRGRERHADGGHGYGSLHGRFGVELRSS